MKEKDEILEGLMAAETAIKAFMHIHAGDLLEQDEVAYYRKIVRMAGGTYAFCSQNLKVIKEAKDAITNPVS